VKYTQFLDAKPLYYDKIDLERMPKTYESIKNYLPHPRVVHIVGTNGKGTTGRFLANALLKNGLNVGHYTSPHILRFNERIWINGRDADDIMIESAHKWLYSLLGKENADALSYFEYSTFLAMKVFEKCDIVVLEAGLGGEFDATNVFEKELSLFTPIGFDHQAFLGESIEEIASTKFRSMAKTAILGAQPYGEVEALYEKTGSEKNSTTLLVSGLLSENDIITIQKIAHKLSLADYLKQNLSLAVSALNVLKIPYGIDSFAESPMFGRLTRIDEQVILDVGHNTLAAKAIAGALEGEKFTLVYNSFKDKDTFEILRILKPVVQSVEIISVDNVRTESRDVLESALKELNLPYRQFRAVEKGRKYLVFGSFGVAEAFLKNYRTI
jgi:dihydrofolate synthase/folylpolyglutamate synthase